MCGRGEGAEGGCGGGEVAGHIPNKTLDIKLWPFRLTLDAQFLPDLSSFNDYHSPRHIPCT